MSKPNFLLNHLLDSNFRDPPCPIALSGDPNRLTRQYRFAPGNWATVARAISGPNQRPVTWFPDANVVFRQDTDLVWAALRAAAIGRPGGSAVISGVIEAEITDWLNDPWGLKKRAEDIRDALNLGTWIKKFRLMGRTPVMDSAMLSYAVLLGARRSLAQPTTSGKTPVGTNPSDKMRTMDTIKREIGDRAVGLAKKGRQDGERGGISVSDELHCLLTIIYALIHRKAAYVLTADYDYIEIFFKATYLIDMHYRAWLAAPMVNEGRYGEPAGTLSTTDGLFGSHVTLYRRQTLHMWEVLTPVPETTRAGVLFVAPDQALHEISFPFEAGMLEMLTRRGESTGRCTNLFGNANIHIDLGPLKPQLDGLFLGIGDDEVLEQPTTHGIVAVSKLDWVHSLACYERSSPSRT